MTDPRWQTVREALGQFSFQATNPYLADAAYAALDALEEEMEDHKVKRIDLEGRMDDEIVAHGELEVEVERLRRVLLEVAEGCEAWPGHWSLDLIAKRARAALGGEE